MTDYKEKYERLHNVLYDDFYHRDAEDSCGCEYIINNAIDDGEITIEEYEYLEDNKEMEQKYMCQYCTVCEVLGIEE